MFSSSRLVLKAYGARQMMMGPRCNILKIAKSLGPRSVGGVVKSNSIELEREFSMCGSGILAPSCSPASMENHRTDLDQQSNVCINKKDKTSWWWYVAAAKAVGLGALLISGSLVFYKSLLDEDKYTCYCIPPGKGARARDIRLANAADIAREEEKRKAAIREKIIDAFMLRHVIDNKEYHLDRKGLIERVEKLPPPPGAIHALRGRNTFILSSKEDVMKQIELNNYRPSVYDKNLVWLNQKYDAVVLLLDPTKGTKGVFTSVLFMEKVHVLVKVHKWTQDGLDHLYPVHLDTVAAKPLVSIENNPRGDGIFTQELNGGITIGEVLANRKKIQDARSKVAPANFPPPPSNGGPGSGTGGQHRPPSSGDGSSSSSSGSSTSTHMGGWMTQESDCADTLPCSSKGYFYVVENAGDSSTELSDTTLVEHDEVNENETHQVEDETPSTLTAGEQDSSEEGDYADEFEQLEETEPASTYESSTDVELPADDFGNKKVESVEQCRSMIQEFLPQVEQAYATMMKLKEDLTVTIKENVLPIERIDGYKPPLTVEESYSKSMFLTLRTDTLKKLNQQLQSSGAYLAKYRSLLGKEKISSTDVKTCLKMENHLKFIKSLNSEVENQMRDFLRYYQVVMGDEKQDTMKDIGGIVKQAIIALPESHARLDGVVDGMKYLISKLKETFAGSDEKLQNVVRLEQQAEKLEASGKEILKKRFETVADLKKLLSAMRVTLDGLGYENMNEVLGEYWKSYYAAGVLEVALDKSHKAFEVNIKCLGRVHQGLMDIK